MTLKALKESIEHWERLRDGTTASDEGISAESCALCDLYFNLYADERLSCSGCPIREYTGQEGCAGTPYGEIHIIFMSEIDLRYFYVDPNISFPIRKKRIEGIPSQRMVDFLNKVKSEMYGDQNDFESIERID